MCPHSAHRFVIACAQLNPIVGDITGNLDKIRAARRVAATQGADLLVTSELVVTGYPPEDLVLKPAFQQAVLDAISQFAEETKDGGPAVLLGTVWRAALSAGQKGPEEESPVLPADLHGLYNAALLIDQGRVVAERFKVDLPNYGVFDEKRLFTAGPLPSPLSFRGLRLGVLICEDLWTPDVVECLQENGADILVSLNGSPWDLGKRETRMHHAVARHVESGLPLLYVNQVGGQDELVFDGASFALNLDRSLAMQMESWIETTAISTWERSPQGWHCLSAPLQKTENDLEAIYAAMMIGLRDYVYKNHFPGVILGLSGGIDSALSAAVAVDALGADKVHAVMMPSPYTSQESLEDAKAIAEMLGIRYDIIDIGPAMAAFETMLAPLFEGRAADVTEENIQSRARGLTLMALSNKFGSMLLTTGNKSEMSVGYATLYGDMCGGYSVLKDVYKTTVFALCQWRNQKMPAQTLGALGPQSTVMPERVIAKPPSAELRPDQKDEDSLPAYDRLDDILERLIEKEQSAEDIIAAGHHREEVLRVWRLLELAEYKRRQSPPGVKITRRNLSRDRRYPITNAFKGGA